MPVHDALRRVLCCSCTVRRRSLCARVWPALVQLLVVAVLWYIIQARYNLKEGLVRLQSLDAEGQIICSPGDYTVGSALTLSDIMSTNANAIVSSSADQPQYLSVEVLVRDLTQGTLVSYAVGTPVIAAGGVERLKADDDFAGHDNIRSDVISDTDESRRNLSAAYANPNRTGAVEANPADTGNIDLVKRSALHQVMQRGGDIRAVLNQMNAGRPGTLPPPLPGSGIIPPMPGSGNPLHVPGSGNPVPPAGNDPSNLAMMGQPRHLGPGWGAGSSGGQRSWMPGSQQAQQGSQVQADHQAGSIGLQQQQQQRQQQQQQQQQQHQQQIQQQQQPQHLEGIQQHHVSGQLSLLNGLSGQAVAQQESLQGGQVNSESGQASAQWQQGALPIGNGPPLIHDIPHDEHGPVVNHGLSERLMQFKMELYGKATDTIEVDSAGYIMNSEHVCAGTPEVTVLFLIHAQPQSDDRRSMIRDTFVKPGLFQDARIAYVFLVGRTNSPNFQRALDAEFAQYADIVQGDFYDKENKTRKAMMGLQWAYDYCRGALYVMKIDEDVFVDSDKLIHGLMPALQGVVGPRSILCYLTTDASVPRSGPKAISRDLFPHSTTLRPHCKAFAVLMTRGVVSSLLETAKYAPYVSSEDLYIFGVLPYLAGHVEVYDVGSKRAFHDFGQEAVNCYRESGNLCPLVASKAFSSRFTDLWQFVQERMTSQHDWRIQASLWDMEGARRQF